MLWIGLIAALFLAGAGMSLFYGGQHLGKAECQAEIAAADAKLKAKSDELKQEAANHIDDMVVAYQSGEANSTVIYKTITAKGAKDVQTYPVFSDPKCTLPPESLRNLNAARSNLRTTQGDAKQPPELTQTPPNAPVAAPAPTGVPTTPQTPASAADKRPLGKRP